VPGGRQQAFAFSGVLYPRPHDRGTSVLADHAVGLAGSGKWTRVCYVPTAVGDLPEAIGAKAAYFAGRADVEFSVLRLFTQPSVPDVRAHLLRQHVTLVEGGSVVNLMAVWRAHGLPRIMREYWDAGVVLAGSSAGSLCWHAGGPTDSFRHSLDPFTDGLGFVPYSNGVHDDLADQPRSRIYQELVASGQLPGGYATEDGVGLHYVGTRLHEAVTFWRASGAGECGPMAAADTPSKP
jgi:peptidase E